MIAGELARATRTPGEVLVIRGRHQDHGNTVLIRDTTRCMALVENAGLIDVILVAASDAILTRATAATLH